MNIGSSVVSGCLVVFVFSHRPFINHHKYFFTGRSVNVFQRFGRGTPTEKKSFNQGAGGGAHVRRGAPRRGRGPPGAAARRRLRDAGILASLPSP